MSTNPAHPITIKVIPKDPSESKTKNATRTLASGDPAPSSPIESITLRGHMPIRVVGEARSRAHNSHGPFEASGLDKSIQDCSVESMAFVVLMRVRAGSGNIA